MCTVIKLTNQLQSCVTTADKVLQHGEVTDFVYLFIHYPKNKGRHPQNHSVKASEKESQDSEIVSQQHLCSFCDTPVGTVLVEQVKFRRTLLLDQYKFQYIQN